MIGLGPIIQRPELDLIIQKTGLGPIQKTGLGLSIKKTGLVGLTILKPELDLIILKSGLGPIIQKSELDLNRKSDPGPIMRKSELGPTIRKPESAGEAMF